MNLKSILERTIPKFRKVKDTQLHNDYESFAQAGEDKCIDFIFSNLSTSYPSKFSYLDIGSNDPIGGNNTYYFYKKGGTGVLIEPHPRWEKITREKRPNDIFLNSGISFNRSTEAKYYDFGDAHCVNTFDKKQADFVMSLGHKLIKTTTIKLLSINDVFKKYFPNESVDILSLDVESLELPILKLIDFNKYRPKMFCIESNRRDFKYGSSHKTIEFMEGQKYVFMADTGVNIIFLDTKYFHSNL